MAELSGMEEALRDDLSNAMAEQLDKANSFRRRNHRKRA